MTSPSPRTMSVPPEVEASIRRDCRDAAREMFGEGYVTDYYDAVAADFVVVALACWREGYRRAVAESKGRFGRSIWTYLGARECEHVECGIGCLHRA